MSELRGAWRGPVEDVRPMPRALQILRHDVVDAPLGLRADVPQHADGPPAPPPGDLGPEEGARGARALLHQVREAVRARRAEAAPGVTLV
eukprot:8304923-Pyramimonas_sp.AAC.1